MQLNGCFGGGTFQVEKHQVKPGGGTMTCHRDDKEAGMAGVGKLGGIVGDG